MSAVIGCGIAAAVFAYMWRHSTDEGMRAFAHGAAIGFAISAVFAGFLA